MPNGIFSFFERLISNRNVFMGSSLLNAAFNAANEIGTHPEIVAQYPYWPSIETFDNDTVAGNSPSPARGLPDPEYIWDNPPATSGEVQYFGIASDSFTLDADDFVAFVLFLSAFADDAMEATIRLYRRVGTTYQLVTPQPDGLENFTAVAGTPDDPSTGLDDTRPFDWQNVRVYSTDFIVDNAGTYKIVAAFQVTNYLIPGGGSFNPAALQFLIDLYIADFTD